MPIVKVADRGSLQNLTAETATAVTITGNTTAGNFLIVRLAMDNSAGGGAAPNVSVSGAAGNTWNVLGPSNRDPGAANTGITCYMMYARMDTPLLLNQTVTFDWQGSPPAKAIVIEEWSGIDPDTPIATAEVVTNGATSAVAVTISAPAAGDMVYCALATEGPAGDTTTYDTDTTNGSWSAALTSLATTSGTATSNARIRGQYKLVTAAGNQTWNLTITARDWAALAVVFKAGIAITPKTASDTLSISVTESAIKEVQVDKVASDTLSVSLTESAIVTETEIGVMLSEDFEDDALNISIASGSWIRTTTLAHGGTGSYTNNNITHSQQTDMIVNVPEGATSITFWYKIDSESGWDFFRLLNTSTSALLHEDSGIKAWQQITEDITGITQLTFRYFKDSSQDGGLDSVFIDDLEFIGPTTPSVPKTGTTDPLNISIVEGTSSVVKGLPQTLAPTAIVVQTNLTGAVTDIDEDPDSPDANWMTSGAAPQLTTNIVPTPTSGLETLPAGWAIRTSCTLNQESSQAHSGSFCLGQTKIAGNSAMACQPANHINGGSISIPVIAGNSYVAKVWCRATTTVRTARFFLYWWDSTQVEFAGIGVAGTNSTTAWTEYIVTGKAPNGAVESQLILQIDGAADGEKHLWDDLQLYEAEYSILRVSFPTPDTNLVPNMDQEFRIRLRQGA